MSSFRLRVWSVSIVMTRKIDAEFEDGDKMISVPHFGNSGVVLVVGISRLVKVCRRALHLAVGPVGMSPVVLTMETEIRTAHTANRAGSCRRHAAWYYFLLMWREAVQIFLQLGVLQKAREGFENVAPASIPPCAHKSCRPSSLYTTTFGKPDPPCFLRCWRSLMASCRSAIVFFWLSTSEIRTI